MIISLNHVALAVSDLEKAVSRFKNDIGLAFSDTEVLPHINTQTSFFPINGDTINLELIHPLNEKGPVHDYLKKKGPGLHHICFETDNIQEEIERLKSKNYQFTTKGPIVGAHGSKAIFIHPKCCDGVLIEICQLKAKIRE